MLGYSEHAAVGAHIAGCPVCEAARADFHSIIAVARDARGQLFAPTDEHALWLRVLNTVEAESLPARVPDSAKPAAEGFWSRLFGRRFELSLPQLAAGAAALVVAVASATTFAVRSTGTGERAGGVAVRRVVSDEFYPRTYLEQHKANLNYWEQRVQARKASWNPRMRASFDRSVHALDETVSDSLNDLSRNPHDEVAEEMLNSALRDKIELMREFGEQ